ncbi:hypothetical protein QTP86_016534 [Hemibagrus guttatus]|nr:hypothetical protein QTP86_016534 [Hemibagrus guttatus]
MKPLSSLLHNSERKPEMREHFVSFIEEVFENRHAEVAPPLKDEEERFCKESVPISADIQQMFYCFLVKEQDRSFLRVLWFRDNDPSKDIVEYCMKVHIFGNRPSPTVAIYGLRKAAYPEGKEQDSEVQQFVERDFYVDNGLKSLPAVEAAVTLLKWTQNIIARSKHISTGSPQGCVLYPLLFSLYTNGCTSGHQSVKLLKFADDTTLIGLISDGNESAYRGEIDRLVSWCSTNNLELNSLKTVEMTVDFRKDPAPRPPVILCDSPVSSAESFCFLGTTITKELKWAQNISSLTKKAQQRMYFLRQLKKFLLPVKMLVNFYTAIIESVLTSSITVWFAAATARDKAKLQRVIHSAEKVIGCSLPSLQELYVSRSRRRAAKIAADPSHPGNELFRSLPSGKRLRSIRTRTSRHKNSFFPTAVSLLNSAPLTPR